MSADGRSAGGRGAGGGSAAEDLRRHIVKNRMLYLILVPGFTYFILFQYLPMYGLVIAFKDYNIFKGILGSEWIGFENFRSVFSQPQFFIVFRNSLVINLYKLVINFPLPIVVAILIDEIGNRAFKRTTQTIIYFPFFLSWVVIAGLVINLLSPSTGVVNVLLEGMGLKRINFLAKKEYFRSILVLSDLWHILGWHSVIYLAALTGVDPQLYEAAKIDGAGRLTIIRRITLPAIMTTINVLLLMRIGNMLNMGFEQVFLLYNPLVYEVGDVLETYIYRIGLVEARYEIATAVGLFKSFIGLALLLSADAVLKRLNGRGLF
jgi:putative aldouronate transport system permease protein